MQQAQMGKLMQRISEQEDTPPAQAVNLVVCYSKLLDHIMAAARSNGGKSLVLGLCGPQRAGKSTMARVIKEALHTADGLSVAILSLDDLYLSGTARQGLARDVHPLLRTRGVPGTHDVELGLRVIEGLASAKPGQTTLLPRFDKALDEPCDPTSWEMFTGRADVVIFEGWCVGALPEDARMLVDPVNELERNSDADGRWRVYVNKQLAGHYQRLFALIDTLVLLCAPSFEIIYAWRLQQERQLAARPGDRDGRSGKSKVMGDEELKFFIMHFERLTRHILAAMPDRAAIVVDLDDDRRIVGMRVK
jgi:D-glycerate 3-kinase